MVFSDPRIPGQFGFPKNQHITTDDNADDDTQMRMMMMIRMMMVTMICGYAFLAPQAASSLLG